MARDANGDKVWEYHKMAPAPEPSRDWAKEFKEQLADGRITFGTPEPPAPDAVNHPEHYTAHPSGVECIQVTEWMNFCLGNAVKYIWRADHKGGLEDLEKAAWYIQREIARRQQKGKGL